MKLDTMFLRALPFALIGSALHAAEVNPEQAAINKTAAAFVDAFHKGDAKTLASFYMPNADYVDASGQIFEGRDVIEKLYTDFFALNKGYQLRLNIHSRKFPSPGLAIEDGTSVVIAPDGTAPVQTRYTNVFSKVDGKWLLSSVREGNAVAPSNYEFLRGLEWSIGEWLDAEPSGSAGRISFVWAPGNNFIVSTRTEDFKDISMLRTTQWIGWDAAAKQIRSWSFQADGGTDLSTWTQNGSAWNIKTESTLANGSKVSSTSVVTPVDADTITWQMKNQTVNGKEVPDTKEVKMKRVK
jgi:uncharacterized protein (TIGR02246 family)